MLLVELVAGGLRAPRPAVTFFFAKKETHERKLLGDELNARVGPLLRSAWGIKSVLPLGATDDLIMPL